MNIVFLLYHETASEVYLVKKPTGRRWKLPNAEDAGGVFRLSEGREKIRRDWGIDVPDHLLSLANDNVYAYGTTRVYKIEVNDRNRGFAPVASGSAQWMKPEAAVRGSEDPEGLRMTFEVFGVLDAESYLVLPNSPTKVPAQFIDAQDIVEGVEMLRRYEALAEREVQVFKRLYRGVLVTMKTILGKADRVENLPFRYVWERSSARISAKESGVTVEFHAGLRGHKGLDVYEATLKMLEDALDAAGIPRL